MSKKIVLFLCLIANSLFAQDINYARKIIDSLSSPGCKGRGYVNNGDRIAAKFIAGEFEKMQLGRYNMDFRQVFNIKVNTLPSSTDVSINNKVLTPGVAFMVSCSSPTMKGTFPIIRLDKKILDKEKRFDKFRVQNLTNTFVLIDTKDSKRKDLNDLMRKIKQNNFLNAKGIIQIREGKISWGTSSSGKVTDYLSMDVVRDSLPKKVSTITVNIKNKYFDEYETQNVAAFITGMAKPDSFIVFCAHYDHLGQMGKDVFFPGANDNASGTAMVLNLAKYFTQTQNLPDYSIAFILFTGEEAGLLGSEYYVEHPLFPLKKIKALFNLDMVGTGSDGITVVNGHTMHVIFNKLVQINETKKYLTAVKKRGQSCNSDHCPFFMKGVPAVFIYSQGSEFSEYHNVYDISKKLPLTKFNEILLLLTDFVKSYNKN